MLRNHEMFKHGPSLTDKGVPIPLGYKCDNCDKVYQDKGQLNGHRRRKHSASVYPCGNCEKEYRTKEDLNRHRKNKHSASVKEEIGPL